MIKSISIVIAKIVAVLITLTITIAGVTVAFSGKKRWSDLLKGIQEKITIWR